MSSSGSEFQIPVITGLMPEAAVGTLIDHAVRLPASDLFFTPNENHVAVMVRHLGLVRLLTILPAEMGRRCMSHIKVMAGMDLAEQRRPLDGRWVRSAEGAAGGNGANSVDLRISTIPTLYGEDFSIRLLARNLLVQSVELLGFPRGDLNDMLSMLRSPSGLLLVTGPTGSGKTTTLYACLKHLHNGERKINTIEDPVEYAIAGIRQSQVNPKLEVGFPELLRSVLRQSPDVIMIGEIRDPITAETAVRAVNSGHLVLATLHAPIAAGAVQSMLSLGVHPHFLASSLLGVVAQRLVRSLCPKCKIEFDISDAPHTFEEVRQWLEPGQGERIFVAQGCPECHKTGYSGRTGVFEVMKISRDVRHLIGEGRPTRDIRQKAVDEGLIELRRSALLKVAQGETNVEEVFRAIPAEYLGIDD